MVFSWKIRGPFNLVYFKADKLHYLRITNTTILVYGKDLLEAFEELGKVFESLNTMKDEVNIYRKDTMPEKLLYLLGRFNTFLFRIFIESKNKNINKNIENIKKDLIAFNVT